MRNWYQANRERRAESKRKWYEANKERALEHSRNYYASNKEYLTENKRRYHKHRRDSDPLYRLSCNIRSLINQAFKRNGYSKNTKTRAIIGCSFEYLLAHLYNSAVINYGYYDPGIHYHIDHIIPSSSAASEEELIMLNHYSNLQYLTPQDNLKKSDKIVQTQLATGSHWMSWDGMICHRQTKKA